MLVAILVCVTIKVNAQNYAVSLPGGSDGNASNVALPALNITALPITVEAWVYPIANNNYGGVFYYRGVSTNGGVQFDRWTNPNSFRGIANDGVNVVADENLVFNAWNHVAWVVTASNMTIYINGEAKSTTGSPDVMSFDSGLYIGWDAATADRTIQGYFDEVRVWTTERTAQEIEDNKSMVLNGDEAGLYGYWNFDDQAVGVATDLTSNGFDGTINGGSYITSTLDLTLDVEKTILEAKSEYRFYAQKNTLFANSSSSKNMDYKLYTITGQLISKGELLSNGTTNLGNHSTGIYIVQLGKEVPQSFKIVVK